MSQTKITAPDVVFRPAGNELGIKTANDVIAFLIYYFRNSSDGNTGIMKEILDALGGGGGDPATETTLESFKTANHTDLLGLAGYLDPIAVFTQTIVSVLQDALYTSGTNVKAATLLQSLISDLSIFSTQNHADLHDATRNKSVAEMESDALYYINTPLATLIFQLCQSGGQGVSVWCQELRDVMFTQNPNDSLITHVLGVSSNRNVTLDYRACAYVQVTSLVSGIEFRGSLDNITYFPVLCEKLSSGQMTSVVDENGIYRFSQNLPYFEIISDATGSANLTIKLTSKNS